MPKNKTNPPAPQDKQTMADLMPTSPDLRAERLAQLRKLFPDLFDGEGRLNEKELRQLANPDQPHLKERYEFTWTGKQASKQEAFKPSNAALVYDEKRSVNPDTPGAEGNLIIEGENLETLKLLTSAYRGQVKLIYIDPPYNTGKDFVYSDNYTEEKQRYWEQTGVKENGVKVDTNTDADGRYHSNWLRMMHSRLLAARYLLREDGVIFISIDDNEVANLRRLGDTVLGEENFLAILAVQVNPRGRHLDEYIAQTHEYVLVYARDAANSEVMMGLEKEGRMLEDYDKEDDRGKYRDLGLRNRNQAFNPTTRPKLFYPLYVNSCDGTVAIKQTKKYDREVWPITTDGVETCWTWGKAKVEAEGEILVGQQIADGEWRISRKDYLKSENGEIARTLPKSLWLNKEFNNDYGRKEVKSLFGDAVMDFPKSPALIQQIVNLGTQTNAIVLDFFAGSGTTGQAVMDLNAADGGNRKQILVQLPELTAADSTAYKAGYKKISDITIERNKRVIERYRKEADTAERAAKEAEKALAKAEKAKQKQKLPGMSDDKELDKLREKAEGLRADADKKRDFSGGLGFKTYTLEKSAFPRVNFVPDPDATEDENVAKLRQYIEEKEASFHQTWDRPRLLDEVLLKNGFSFDYELTRVKAFADNEVEEVTDGLTGRTALICLDAHIADATLDAFKPKGHAADRTDAFICLERALDTTKKWNLKHRLGERLRAM